MGLGGSWNIDATQAMSRRDGEKSRATRKRKVFFGRGEWVGERGSSITSENHECRGKPGGFDGDGCCC